MNLIMKTVFLIAIANCAMASEIAITFDDLPAQQNESAEIQRVINQRILSALDKFEAPAIGFVNEGKLFSHGETAEKTAILQSWIDHGHPLGNHTYSHFSMSNTALEVVKKDVLKGAIVSRNLMAARPYRYYRHPFLHTGTTKEMRTAFEAFLKAEGYLVAPITIDTDDWKFNMQLLQHPEDKDKIIQKYLEHTREKFVFYEAATKKLFGRNIRHTWLLHANLLNSYAMKDLLKLARELGYSFITMDKALEDPAYSEADEYYEPFGVSWLYRWDFTRGKVIDWSKEPETDNSPFVKASSLTCLDESRNRSIPVEMYVSGEAMGKAEAGIYKFPVAIINHGYGVKNSEYSFLANALAARGHLVASIQHDLEEDPQLPRTGNLFERRKPLWDRGAQNIKFVLDEIMRTKPYADLSQVILIGHSNGGDISMLFAELNPKLVSKVVSLDSLRYPFPTANGIPILSLRANDTKADQGVLPESDATLIDLKEAKHIDMCDRGPDKVKREIVDIISSFLGGKL